MKYTKKQRCEIYTKALDGFNNDGWWYMCNGLKFRIEVFVSKETLPELFMFKPKYNGSNGWCGDPTIQSNKEHRKTILEFCIYMTSNK